MRVIALGTGGPRPDPDRNAACTVVEVGGEYPTHDAYVAAVERVCAQRVSERLMLHEDADRFIAAARKNNPLDPAVRLAPLIQAGAYTGR